MRKIIFFIVTIFVVASFGCSICGCTNSKEEGKKKKIDYTVSDYEEVPKEVQKVIDKRKKEKVNLSFTDKENTYIVVCYGEKRYEGYSIKVDEVKEDNNRVYVSTTLNGPNIPKEKNQKKSFPYIIIKIEYTDKSIGVRGN